MKATILVPLILANLAVGNCTLLATAGYIAASPLIRNYLINSGLSDKIRQQSESLYDVSGFRFVSDQGTDIRKAAMDDHELVEVGFAKRQGTLALERKHSQEEDRTYSEKLFSVLNRMDRNACISRLLCEIGANANSYGIVGLKIRHYLQSVPPVTWNSATHPYIECFKAGLKDGKQICDEHYYACSYNLNRVVEFLWYFMNPVHI